MNRLVRCLLAVLMLSVLIPASAAGGKNCNGTAWLSWDLEGKVSGTNSLRSLPFPLFLHLAGATDMHEVAVTLRWMPADTAGCAYKMIPTPIKPDTSMGWTAPSASAMTFETDASYSWRIFLPTAEKGRDCVVYWFTVADCDTAPRGRFFLSDVRTRDSAGQIDRLRIVGQATVLGGPLPKRSPGSETAPAIQSPLAPQAFEASPNPTTSTILLRYALPGEGPGAVHIFDVAGRLVRRMACSSRGGAIEWHLDDSNGSPVGRGLYFARLTTPLGSRTIRLVVLR